MSRITFEEVKQSIENSGWKLLSSTYVNLKTDLEICCPEGHNAFVSFDKWRKGNFECPICNQNKFYSVQKNPIKKNGHRVLALDQATYVSGWSIFDDQNLVSYGTWEVEGKDAVKRIAKVKGWLASMIQKWQPDTIVIEDIQLQTYKKNQSEDINAAVVTYKTLAQLQGVLQNYLYEINVIFKTAPPGTWRNFSGVKGNHRTDQKKSAQIRIKELYGFDVKTDEADAILIGRWAAHNNSSNKIIFF